MDSSLMLVRAGDRLHLKPRPSPASIEYQLRLHRIQVSAARERVVELSGLAEGERRWSPKWWNLLGRLNRAVAERNRIEKEEAMPKNEVEIVLICPIHSHPLTPTVAMLKDIGDGRLFALCPQCVELSGQNRTSCDETRKKT